MDFQFGRNLLRSANTKEKTGIVPDSAIENEGRLTLENSLLRSLIQSFVDKYILYIIHAV